MGHWFILFIRFIDRLDEWDNTKRPIGGRIDELVYGLHRLVYGFHEEEMPKGEHAARTRIAQARSRVAR